MNSRDAMREAKQTLRAASRTRRAARSTTQRNHADALRAQHILDFLGTSDSLETPSDITVASYLSIEPEPDTTEIIAALHAKGVRVLLPVLRRVPDWAPYAGPDALRPAWRGIPEPTTDPLGADALLDADAVLVSALAVTPRGDRLGVGGGWYDRALAHCGPATVTVALVSDDEILDSLPCEPWDRRVDVLATESGVRRADA